MCVYMVVVSLASRQVRPWVEDDNYGARNSSPRRGTQQQIPLGRGHATPRFSMHMVGRDRTHTHL